ncbi:hypothetical protein GOODEAATRI_014492 [Goodea atripinnis]|uniref:Uncharacterized protein n=1 Tax=Goodea atripinnis TaxID=208336 RepID=A0ABV0P4G2_9TELE
MKTLGVASQKYVNRPHTGLIPLNKSTDNSNPNTDNFRIIVVRMLQKPLEIMMHTTPTQTIGALGDSVCERVFTVNDVSHGGCKYGIMNFSSGSRGSLSVEMCDNLYFTNRKVPVLFNGCRSGEIFSIDLRQRGRRDHSWKAKRFHHESAITSVRVLQDENYLLAADMLVGQDCYTRLWSLKDGHLLRTIPSPHPAANDMIPSVVFSSNLGGSRGLPGLLMAVRHDLYYFPYNTDYQEGGELCL